MNESTHEDFSKISRMFQRLPQYEPTPATLAMIKAYAHDYLLRPKKTFSFSWSFKPLYAFAVLSCVVVGLLYVSRGGHQPAERASLNQWLLSTPLDQYPLRDQKTDYQKSFHLLTPVSSRHPLDFFKIEDEIGEKILSQTPTVKELELLFFRAQKMEKLGYYRAALKDYVFMNRFGEFSYRESIPLAMAHCYEQLGEEDKAIPVLEEYLRKYGDKQDVRAWLDELKSETF